MTDLFKGIVLDVTEDAAAAGTVVLDGGLEMPVAAWAAAHVACGAAPIMKAEGTQLVEAGMASPGLLEFFLSGSAGPCGVLSLRKKDESGWVATLKSTLPYAVSKAAVESGEMPPLGKSALPQSLAGVVPRAYRYWDQQDPACAKRARDALVGSGFFQEDLIKAVDGEMRLCVSRLFLYEPSEDVEKAAEEAMARPAAPLALEKRAVRVLKAEEAADERYVLGEVLVPEEVDAQEDIYSPEEIRRAAHGYMEKFQTVGLMHEKNVSKQVRVLESYIAPCDMTVGETVVKAGSWVMAVRVLDDELWASVKSGALTGFSIGGTAVRQPDAPEKAATE